MCNIVNKTKGVAIIAQFFFTKEDSFSTQLQSNNQKWKTAPPITIIFIVLGE